MRTSADIEPDLTEWDYEHDRPDEPVVAIWNAGSRGMLDSALSLCGGEKITQKGQAIQRWENEGGEIPH